MSEFYPTASLELSQYQDFVANSRFKNKSDNDWQAAYASLIQGEQLEFLDQHGPGALLLLPRGFGVEPEDIPSELRFHMADEMGDLLWFATDATDRLGLTTQGTSTHALEQYSGEVLEPLSSFHDLERAATQHANAIRVANKLGLQFPELTAADLHYTSLADHPFYVFMRATNRLSRCLNESERDMAPPTATELEPVQDIATSLGTFMLTLAYLAKDRLGISLDAVATFNIAKLNHRQEFGKANDLQFDESFLAGR